MNLGKASFKYQGALIWNNILKHEIVISVSDHLFAKNIKGLRLQQLSWSISDNCSPSLEIVIIVYFDMQRLLWHHVYWMSWYQKDPVLIFTSLW